MLATSPNTALLERAITRRRTITSPDGLRMARVEADWWIVQRDVHTAGVYVSVIVDMHGVVHCTCPSGLTRCGCPHVLAVGELLDGELPEHLTRQRRARRFNVGERNGRAKLTAEQALEIRRAYAAERVTLSTLAVRFGVSQATIHGIVSGRNWQQDALA